MKIKLATIFHQTLFSIICICWFGQCMINESRKDMLNRLLSERLTSMSILELTNTSIRG